MTEPLLRRLAARGEVLTVVALPWVAPVYRAMPQVAGGLARISGMLGPNGPLGQLTTALGLGTLPFTYWGQVLGSLIYSLPFAVQPLQGAFEAIGERPLEAAATLGAGPLDRFFTVALPLARGGFVTAAILSFAHTVGEFGVVLMLGGNIPGVTRVISVQIYDHVEALEYTQAHWLACGMVVFSFIVLLGLNLTRRARLLP
jgi:molybdate transport system permease protein